MGDDAPRKTFAPKIPGKKKKKKKTVVKAEPDVSSAPSSSSSSSKSLSKAPVSIKAPRGRQGGGRGRGRRREQYTHKGEGIFSHGFSTGEAASASSSSRSRSMRAGPPSIRAARGRTVSSIVTSHNHEAELDITKEERPHEGSWYLSTEPQDRPTFLPLGTTTVDDDKDYSAPIEPADEKPGPATLSLSDTDRSRLAASGAQAFVAQSNPELLFFQFPDPLPFPTPSGIPPEVKTEPGTSSSSSSKAKQEPARANISTLPSGHLGKLRVYKSGRMELVFGSVRFELKQGTKSTFAQEVVAIDPHSKYPTTVCLGSLRRRYTAIPDVQQLLERTTL